MSKRPLEYGDSYAQKRVARGQPHGANGGPHTASAPAGELDLEALVAQLNHPPARFDDGGLLERQIEGAIASLAAESVPAMQFPGSGLGSGPGSGARPAPRSSDYDSHLEAQLEGHLTQLPRESTALEAKKRCFPILDSLACQILEYLGTGHYQEVLNIVTQPDSEKGRALQAIVDIFEQTKKMYVDEDEPFILYRHEFRDYRTTVQRANLASWCSAAFGLIEIGFYDLDKWFMPSFIPENSRLLKSQTSVYLELKTQAYISSLSQTQKTPQAALDELFPTDLGKKMLEARIDRQALNNSETDFVSRCLKRRENIEGVTDQLELAKTYQWVFFLRDLTDYISKHHYTLLPHPAQALRNTLRAQQPQPAGQTQAQPLTGSPAASAPVPAGSAASASDGAGDAGDASTHAGTGAGAGAGASGGANSAAPSGSATPTAGTGAAPGAGPGAAPPSAPAGIPSAGTAAPAAPRAPPASASALSKKSRRELGEEAKKAASAGLEGNTLTIYQTARASTEGMENSRPARNSGLTRRSWSKEEEEALLEGLDKVQGPYWSQILELYGAGGSISEVLKDRNQVQLKDKARNLKMFFERCQLPVPEVFRYVTGNYETRKSSGRKARNKKRVDDSSRASPMPQSTPQRNMQLPNMPPMPQGPYRPDDDLQQSAEVLDRALNMLRGEESNIQHLMQSVGNYINQ